MDSSDVELSTQSKTEVPDSSKGFIGEMVASVTNMTFEGAPLFGGADNGTDAAADAPAEAAGAVANSTTASNSTKAFLGDMADAVANASSAVADAAGAAANATVDAAGSVANATADAAGAVANASSAVADGVADAAGAAANATVDAAGSVANATADAAGAVANGTADAAGAVADTVGNTTAEAPEVANGTALSTQSKLSDRTTSSQSNGAAISKDLDVWGVGLTDVEKHLNETANATANAMVAVVTPEDGKHMDTQEAACSECAEAVVSSCFAGDCGDGSGKFCWSQESADGYTPC